MSEKPDQYLTKREQQIMEVLYQNERADVAAVMAGLPNAPSNPAVHTHLRTLEAKGVLVHTEETCPRTKTGCGRTFPDKP